IAKLTHAVNQQTSALTTAMTTILKQFQATPPSAFVKAVEEICVTCGGAHPYYQCLAAGGKTFPELRDNIQGYVSAAAVNYNQGYNRGNNFNPEQSYQAPTQQNQIVPLNELEKVKRMNEANMKAMQTQINIVNNKLRNEMKNSIQASLSNQTNEIKNMMASLFQMNTASTSGSGSLPSNTVANPKGELKAITTQSGFVLDGPTVPTPPPFINSEPSGNPTFSSHPELTSPKVKNDIFDSEGGNVLPKKLLDLDSTKDLHPPIHVNPLSDSTTHSSSPNQLLEEVDALPSTNNEDKVFNPCILIQEYPFEIIIHVVQDKKLATSNASFVIEDFDLPLYELSFFKEIPSLKDSIDQINLADNFVDSMPEMFIDEHAPDYSSPLIFDEYDDDLFKVESKTENVYDDPFESNGEKIKESKLLIDELDLSRSSDFLPSPEYDLFLYEDFSEVDAFPSTNNEDK
nr:reverse transcriptase domain-containing protein [Tanacetum cinerariifolium]